MEHREAHRPTEAPVREREGGGIAKHDLHMRAGVTRLEPSGEVRVDLDARQPGKQASEDVSGRPVARPDLEHIVTKIDVSHCPRDDLVPDRGSPFRTVANPVSVVHVNLWASPSSRMYVIFLA